MRPKSMKDLKTGEDGALRESQPTSTRRVRGLRDVMSSRKVAGRSVPATRTQQLSEIAWLDRELERLRREAAIMEANFARVNGRILEVSDRREMLLTMLRQEFGLDQAPAAPAEARRARSDEDAEEKTVNEFSLEY